VFIPRTQIASSKVSTAASESVIPRYMLMNIKTITEYSCSNTIGATQINTVA
jgi:hypothetical protein